ncbi:MAG: hypothetical protein FD123_175 [Bacteroidetes bacterium]|nr:MAG: hypothetical protein FD123_175 [Bacteroidota bacterium]
MICTNCGNNIHAGASSCNRCGMPVYQQQQQQNQYQQNPTQNWGQQPSQQTGWGAPPDNRPSQDTGFLLLACLFAGYALIGFLLNMAGLGWEISRIIYLLLFVAEWAVLIMFTRNASYRIIMIVLGSVMLLYRISEFF